MIQTKPYHLIQPGSFERENHWYDKALNATIHPMVAYFLNLDQDRIVERYCHLHPVVDRDHLKGILNTTPRYFRWAGADLINVTDASANRQMVVIENNSCPSGQKSLPLTDDHQEYGGYKALMEQTFLASLKGQRLATDGITAVLYDKNPMECSGYAATLADILDEEVYLIYFPVKDYHSYLRFKDGFLQLKTDKGRWVNIKAAFRYVTQKPWTRIPISSKTRILNPVLACLAGGRNKMIAAKAYDIYNAELHGSGLEIRTPYTIWDVSKGEVPLWVKRLGGQAVVKVPYSNAGQGVYTIINPTELNAFMSKEFPYDRFIVQGLIGNYQWSSTGSKGKLYHVGTIPTKKGLTYVFDLRMMVHSTPDGIRPLCVYSRRAPEALANEVGAGAESWPMLGTNLSYLTPEGEWGSDTSRLLLMDRRDFNILGLGLDDLIEGYIQTVLSMIAIDNMAQTLINSKGKFRRRLFASLNNDPKLLSEIIGE